MLIYIKYNISIKNLLKMSQKYKIKPEKYGFPSNIGEFFVKTISWKDFPARPPQDTWFLAYTYWSTNYTCTAKNGKGKVVATVSIGPKAWTRAKDDFRLLEHQTGHYWIACHCALQFMKRVNYIQQQPKQIPFLQFCQKTFKKISLQFSEQQKRYDKQTYHYLNENDQDRWQLQMVAKFNAYHQFFQEKKKEQEKKQATIKLKMKSMEIKNQRSRKMNSLSHTLKTMSNQNRISANMIKQPNKKNEYNIRKQINKPVKQNINRNIEFFSHAQNSLQKNVNFLQKMK